MKIQEQFQERTVGFYLGLAGGVVSLVAFLFYIIYGNATGERNIWILLPLLAAVIIEIVEVMIDSDILTVLAPVCCTIALCEFVIDSINTFVGYIFKLAMFGDVSMFGSIVRICVLIGIAMILLVVSSYMRKRKN